MITVRPARADEHATLVALAKRSPYTKDFSNQVMFSSESAYEKGWIWVAEEDGQPVGMACVRHKSRSPETMLYFIHVSESARRKSVGRLLLQAIMDAGPHTLLRLSVMNDNAEALEFYRRLGFTEVGPAYKGAGTTLEREYA